MQIKLNTDLKTPKRLIKKDSIITIEDIDGVPTSLFWRNRIKDSAIDNCVEIVLTKKKDKK